MTKITEQHIQAILMQWVLFEKHHLYFIPNSNQFFDWEADLISIAKSGFAHEFEIKLTLSDFKADAKKRKHFWIGEDRNAPAYFWYVTYGFEILPPEKAGWILITKVDPKTNNHYDWKIEVKKNAPRLNTWKIDKWHQDRISRILAYRLNDAYRMLYLHY